MGVVMGEGVKDLDPNLLRQSFRGMKKT